MDDRPRPHRRIYRLCIITLKYYPVAAALILLVHAIDRTTDLLPGMDKLCTIITPPYPQELAVIAASYIPDILILMMSYAYSFCTIHKSLCWYIVIVHAAIDIDHYIGWGRWLQVIGALEIVIGITLFANLLSNIKQYHRHCGTAENTESHTREPH